MSSKFKRKTRKHLGKKRSYKRRPVRKSKFHAIEEFESFALIVSNSSHEDQQTVKEYIERSEKAHNLDFDLDDYYFHVYLLDHKTGKVVGRATGLVELEGKKVRLETIDEQNGYAVILDRLDVNSAYQGKGKCADIVSMFIQLSNECVPNILYFELENIGGMAGCRCYTGTFAAHNYLARSCDNEHSFGEDFVSFKTSCQGGEIAGNPNGWLYSCIRFYKS
jgi:hypothetical protein